MMTLSRSVQLGEPHDVGPPGFRRVDLREGFGESAGFGLPGRALKLVKDGEFHRLSSHISPDGAPRDTTEQWSDVA